MGPQRDEPQLDTLEIDEQELEMALSESLAEEAPQGDTVPRGQAVSEQDFVRVVDGALEAVDGHLLFKLCVRDGEDGEHVAVASVGEGDNRQFLLLTLPVHGGVLKVETTAKSENPVAGIAAAYAGLMDVFQAAA
ncbi:hypothetical protein [Mesorhizobium sp. SP-1A]|uniref:hypothetical protein n=1 Tax=Mesorhizobium sp. SP-1A TaxID=3077840 RepID=UPI0028F6D34A|nr:hypothetical protein [Mesorhizobium sp. SP-1A]